ncbi:hypothetical protein CMI47_02465 [Candidatus Pacearchaeota archaeon]|nr:hypothetical protein [Candidatus Pacearchaeota archaeon]
MIFIAHRGNVRGPDPARENEPTYIDIALQAGFFAEVDVRVASTPDMFVLGHDIGEYDVDLSWFLERREKLFIHAKDLAAYTYFLSDSKNWNVFWHQKDAYTLTSSGYIWAYPGSELNSKCICVMPETASYSNDQLAVCAGICSDFVGTFCDKY